MIRTIQRKRTRAAIRREIVARWAEIVDAAKLTPSAALLAMASLPKAPTLLSTSAKVRKGEKRGILSAILYLAPAVFGGRTTCPWAGLCAKVCLGEGSGLLAMDSSRGAQAWRTALYYGARKLFHELLACEAEALAKRARKLGMEGALRVNGSSDLPILSNYGALLCETYGLQSWEYTKGHQRTGDNVGSQHVTFSADERNAGKVARALEEGHGVAVVFDLRKGEALPEYHLGRKVIDGDLGDDRWNDRAHYGAPPTGGYVVGLRLKASRDRANAGKRAGGFAL
jgi:hypothetical protein